MTTSAKPGAADTGAAPDIGPLGDLIGYHLRRASAVTGNDFARAMAGTGMRQVLFAILSVIHSNPGIHQGAVGRALGIQRANMVSLVNELTDAGLVARTVAPEDRRAFALSLTDDGAAKVAECLILIRAHEAALLSGLSQAERASLLDLLGRIEATED